MNLRCSSLPLDFACPGSVRASEGEILIETANEGAPLGSAVHEVLSDFVAQGGNQYPVTLPYAVKYGVDPHDLGRLVSYGFSAWKELSPAFPNPLTEQELTAGDLTGHIDLLSLQLAARLAAIADWKSGYRQSDHYHQFMGYCYLVIQNFPDVDTVRATVVWLRDHTTETFRVNRTDVDVWFQDFQQRVVKWDGTYRAGDHCQWCVRFNSCPARQALVRSAIADVSGEGDAGLPLALNPPDRTSVMPWIANLYRTGKLALARQVLDRIDELIRLDITANGPLDLGTGRELALVPEGRDKIDPLRAWPVLTQYLTEEQLAPAVRIGKTALLEAVGDAAPKGQKGKRKTAIMEDLKAAEAVTTETIFKLRERNIQAKEE